MKKKFVWIMFFLFVITIPVVRVNAKEAKNLDEMYKQLTELKKKKSESQSKKQLTEQEMKKINSEIATINSNIEKAKEDIVKANKDIEDSKVKISEKEEETKELLKFLQLSSGENVYLEYLFSADSYTDFIYRYSIVTQLSSYNSNLMEELNKLIADLEDKKIVLANKEKELGNNKIALSKKLESLGGQIKEYDEYAVGIEDEIKSVQESISVYEKLGCGRYEDLSSCIKFVNATSFQFPVVKGTITSNYGYRPAFGDFHSGIDISGFAEGTNVYASANGVVGAIIEKASCGGNKIYIHHYVNGKKYTTAYLHLLSIKVSVGQEVKQGQLIALSGGGASTMWYDGCSTGAHLHFTVANGWYLGSGYHGYSTFLNNTIDPRDVWPGLPAKGSGKYYYR